MENIEFYTCHTLVTQCKILNYGSKWEVTGAD